MAARAAVGSLQTEWLREDSGVVELGDPTRWESEPLRRDGPHGQGDFGCNEIVVDLCVRGNVPQSRCRLWPDVQRSCATGVIADQMPDLMK
jgi:hypothetical protein